MKWFYARAAAVLFVLLATAGTYYMHTVLKTYSGSHTEVYIAWAILVAINSYSLYTMYYDSLMQGQGLIKRSKQIQIVGQSVYLVVAVALILLRFNLIAIVNAQAFSVLIRRVLSYYTIYNPNFKQSLKNATARAKKEFIKPILPNAVKLGLTGVGGFLFNHSAIIMGTLYLSLDDIASYGLTMQIIGIIMGISNIYFTTYQPKIAQYRIMNNNNAIKQCFLKGSLLLSGIFIIGGIGLLLMGERLLYIVGSKTLILENSHLIAALLIAFLSANTSVAGSILLSKNEVPFFKSVLFTGGLILVLLFVCLGYLNLGMWGMILAPGIAQNCYHNWKWNYEVIKDLKITMKDMLKYISNISNNFK
jgi:O-antigen/teichoic acid export membrane protein